MKLFTDYIKRSRNIRGKRVTIFIDARALESRVNGITKEIKTHYLLHQVPKFIQFSNFSKTKIVKSILFIVFESMFGVIRDYASFIKYESLKVIIKISYEKGSPYAAIYMDKQSRDNNVFFKLDVKYLIACFYLVLAGNDRNLANMVTDIFKSGNLYKTFMHEFMHHIDKARFDEINVIGERLKRFFGDIEYGTDLVRLIAFYRIEGLSMLFRDMNRKFIRYEKGNVNLNREIVSRFAGVWPSIYRRLRYPCGEYMAYFIGLSYLFTQYPAKFNEMRAYYNDLESKFGSEPDFLFYSEGMRRILERGNEFVYLQNLPKRIIIRVCKDILKMSHITFIKKYEESCAILGIPKQHIILTFSDYKRMKLAAFEAWKRDVESGGFSSKGINPE